MCDALQLRGLEEEACLVHGAREDGPKAIAMRLSCKF